MSKISIIIPCYNYGKYIEEAIESVFKQTFHDFEIIIVNDGSTDELTIKVLREIGEKYPEILIINQENGGLANARNAGIKAAKGEFILPLDADDMIHQTMLGKCYSLIEQSHKLGFVYTYPKLFGDIEEIWKSQEYNFYSLLMGNYIVATSLIRKKAWEEIGGYDENMKNGYEDWEFYIRLGKNGWFGKLIKEPLFFYRKHGTSMIDETIKKHEATVEYIKNKHTDIYMDEKILEIQRLCKLISEKDAIIEQKQQVIDQKQGEINVIIASKFWKLRRIYLKFKFAIFSPQKFLIKYLQKLTK